MMSNPRRGIDCESRYFADGDEEACERLVIEVKMASPQSRTGNRDHRWLP
jgi:hypothetical protein